MSANEGGTVSTAEAIVIGVVTDRPLDLAAHEAAVADRRAGAVVSFQGVVRDHDHGRTVTLLEYEGHPTAEAVLREVAAEIAADPEVYAVAVSHRIGRLEIGTWPWSQRSAPRTGRRPSGPAPGWWTR